MATDAKDKAQEIAERAIEPGGSEERRRIDALAAEIRAAMEEAQREEREACALIADTQAEAHARRERNAEARKTQLGLADACAEMLAKQTHRAVAAAIRARARGGTDAAE
jgi:hypothetical protein